MAGMRVYTKVWGMGRFFGFCLFGLAALSDDAQAVVIEVSKAVGAALDEFHFAVEAFGDAVVFGEAPHAGDGLLPVTQGIGEGDQRAKAAVGELVDDFDESRGEFAALAFFLVAFAHQ